MICLVCSYRCDVRKLLEWLRSQYPANGIVHETDEGVFFVACKGCSEKAEFTCTRCRGRGMSRQAKCRSCSGTGRKASVAGGAATRCSDCRGTGMKTTFCPACHGNMRVDCSDCGGSGYEPPPIPASAEPGGSDDDDEDS